MKEVVEVAEKVKDVEVVVFLPVIMQIPVSNTFV